MVQNKKREFNGLLRLAFQKSGKPRRWLRRLVLTEDEQIKPGRAWLVKRWDGTPNAWFAPWMNRNYPKRGGSAAADWIVARHELLASGKLQGLRRITVISTRQTRFIAEMVQAILGPAGFSIMLSDRYTEDESDLYIVIAAQASDDLPPSEKRICFQVEQSVSDRWFTERYLDILQFSLAVFDYSQINLAYLQAKGFRVPDLFYVPIAPIPHYGSANRKAPMAKDVDILFYGDAKCPRRQEYLNALKAEFSVRIESDMFGAKLHDAVRRARVVVNIHYYEGALLETTRLSEALSLGAVVVSETSADHGEHAGIEDQVIFAPVGDIPAMIAAVRSALAAPQGPFDAAPLFQKTRFMLLRGLLSLGVMTFEEVLALTLDDPLPGREMCLGLPEDIPRFQASRGASAADFAGIKLQPGWVGCALSYRYLAAKALHQGITPILVHEDDALFPPDRDARRAVIDAYLAEYSGNWDVFSGLLSDVSDETEVTDVAIRDGVTFVTVNRLLGMVYGIYERGALEKISGWTKASDDSDIDQIDRYLERQRDLRVVTTVPPFVAHNQDLHSTLWERTNSDAQKAIDRSQAKLVAKVAEFLAARDG
ncbi:MAG: hypothetical protein ACRC14_06745 [Paracoccaceae bacterium]